MPPRKNPFNTSPTTTTKTSSAADQSNNSSAYADTSRRNNPDNTQTSSTTSQMPQATSTSSVAEKPIVFMVPRSLLVDAATGQRINQSDDPVLSYILSCEKDEDDLAKLYQADAQNATQRLQVLTLQTTRLQKEVRDLTETLQEKVEKLAIREKIILNHLSVIDRYDVRFNDLKSKHETELAAVTKERDELKKQLADAQADVCRLIQELAQERSQERSVVNVAQPVAATSSVSKPEHDDDNDDAYDDRKDSLHRKRNHDDNDSHDTHRDKRSRRSDDHRSAEREIARLQDKLNVLQKNLEHALIESANAADYKRQLKDVRPMLQRETTAINALKADLEVPNNLARHEPARFNKERDTTTTVEELRFMREKIANFKNGAAHSADAVARADHFENLARNQAQQLAEMQLMLQQRAQNPSGFAATSQTPSALEHENRMLQLENSTLRARLQDKEEMCQLTLQNLQEVREQRAELNKKYSSAKQRVDYLEGHRADQRVNSSFSPVREAQEAQRRQAQQAQKAQQQSATTSSTRTLAPPTDPRLPRR